MQLQNKKLAIFIYSLSAGGAERVASVLLKNLESEYDIDLVLINDDIFYDVPKSIKITYLENSSPMESGIKKLIKIPFLAYKYSKFCKANKIDISLSLMYRPNYINILSKYFGNEAKIIISERALPSEQHRHGMQGMINKFLIKILYSKAKYILANSKGNRKDLIDNFNINSSNIKTIYNPVDIDMIDRLKTEDVNLDNSSFNFITVGRLDHGKNHSLLLDALYQMEDKKCKLFILGDGELRTFLQDKINSLNLSDRVFLLGTIDNPYKYLYNSNCFVFSSKHEGFPNVLLEALACNLPIISTDCKSGPREIISISNENILPIDKMEFAEYGILIPNDNSEQLSFAMDKIIKDVNMLNKYKSKSLVRIKDFDIQTIIEQFSTSLKDTVKD